MNFWQNKRVLVTGGHGFLGKHLVKQLGKLNCKKLFVPYDYNLCVPDQIMAMLDDVGRIDVLFHLAANVGGIGYNQDKPYRLFYDNAIMGLNLINLSIMCDVKKFVAVGTTCSYPKYCAVPFKESDLWAGYPEETNAPYGLSKKMMLAQLQAARQQFGFNGVYVVLANLYGPGDNFSNEKSHVIPALIKKIVNAKRTDAPHINVWGTGNPTRDFLYVEDAVKGLIAAAEKYDQPEPINLGSGKDVSIAALVYILKQTVGCKAETNWQVDKPDGQPKRLLDISRAIELLDWQPEVDLRTGLTKTVEWYERGNNA